MPLTVAIFNLVDETTGVAIGANILLTFSVAIRVPEPPSDCTLEFDWIFLKF